MRPRTGAVAAFTPARDSRPLGRRPHRAPQSEYMERSPLSPLSPGRAGHPALCFFAIELQGPLRHRPRHAGDAVAPALLGNAWPSVAQRDLPEYLQVPISLDLRANCGRADFGNLRAFHFAPSARCHRRCAALAPSCACNGRCLRDGPTNQRGGDEFLHYRPLSTCSAPCREYEGRVVLVNGADVAISTQLDRLRVGASSLLPCPPSAPAGHRRLLTLREREQLVVAWVKACFAIRIGPVMEKCERADGQN